jgi:putative membrane protein
MDTTRFADALVSGFVNKHTSKPHSVAPAHPNRSLVKGILAGLAAGIVATAAKTLVEKVYPANTQGKAPAPSGINWGFGLATGAAYGALAEFYPAATSREGVSYGMTLMALTHDPSLPALSNGAPPQTTREKTSEMASHIVYGLVTETVRRQVRRLL